MGRIPEELIIYLNMVLFLSRDGMTPHYLLGTVKLYKLVLLLYDLSLCKKLGKGVIFEHYRWISNKKAIFFGHCLLSPFATICCPK